ncbi:MAG TPA: GlsB/YeaQ/YmgE family stress response membrane protein [Blastocatellia bacterium]|nr:GlsB/YeaQ/YmgE family stress response membrane protein [Blastocatellia bacterium]
MTLVSFLVVLSIVGICGVVGKNLAQYHGGSFLVSIVLGFVGALLGIWIAGALGMSELFAISVGGRPFPLVWSIVGSALFVVLLSLLRRRAQSSDRHSQKWRPIHAGRREAGH